MGERVAYKVLVGKPEGRRQLKKSRGTLEDIIQMGLLELGQVWDWDRRRAVVYSFISNLSDTRQVHSLFQNSSST
jgi:hypothetical protein